MTRTTFLSILIFFSICFSFGQQSRIDSLVNRLQSENDRQKIETYLDLAETDISREEARRYLFKALDVAKRLKFDSIYAVYKYISYNYYYSSDFLNARNYLDSSDNYLEFTRDPISFQASNLEMQGVLSENFGKVDSAQFYYEMGLALITNKTSDDAQLTRASININLANLYLKTGDYSRAIPMYLNSANISAKFGDKENQVAALNNVGSCFLELGDFDKALVYYKRAKILNTETNIKYYSGMIDVGLGQIDIHKGDTLKGVKAIEDAILTLESLQYNNGLSTAYLALSEVFETKNDERALYMSNKTISLLDEIENYFDRAAILINNARLNFKEKKYRDALASLNKSMLISREYEYVDLLCEALEIKIEIYKEINDLPQAISTYSEYLLCKEKIISIEKLKIIEESNAKYQTQQKENQILKLQQIDIEKSLALEKEKSRKLIFASLFGVGFLGFGGFVYYAKNRKRKLEQENKLNIIMAKEMQNNEIATQLHDDKSKQLEVLAIKLEEKDEITIANELMIIKNEIAKISKELIGVSFDESSFDKQIVTLASDYNTKNLTVLLKGHKHIDWNQVKDPVKRNLYLIIREGLSNVYNHSNAKTVSIEFEQNKSNLRLKLRDDGQGFEPEDIALGIGLRNMKVRVNEINGKIDIKSVQGKGTSIFVNIVLA